MTIWGCQEERNSVERAQISTGREGGIAEEKKSDRSRWVVGWVEGRKERRKQENRECYRGIQGREREYSKGEKNEMPPCKFPVYRIIHSLSHLPELFFYSTTLLPL